MRIRTATDADVASIVAVLGANRSDTSLFQQPESQVRRTLGDFLLAVNTASEVEGCAALHWHRPENAEILAVAVVPDAQGRGIGHALVEACIERALERRIQDRLFLWLATAKPGYFERFGFSALSRFRLPVSVIWTKFLLILQQPVGRWLPALFGRHTFMRYRQP